MITIYSVKRIKGISWNGYTKLDLKQQEELEQYKEVNGIDKRSPTKEELNLIDKTIKEKMKVDFNVTMEEFLKELSLEDIGYEEDENTNSTVRFNLDRFNYTCAANTKASVGSI